MAIQHIDVVSDASDRAILQFRRALTGEILAVNVPDMVDKILRRLGGANQIGRLRIFGHAAPGIQVVGPYPIGSQINAHRDGLKLIMLHFEHGSLETGGHAAIMNDQQLLRLTPRFAPTGWIELHGCIVSSGLAGETFLQTLASLFRVPVKAGMVEQFVGGGLEGPVLIAYPSGTVQQRPN